MKVESSNVNYEKKYVTVNSVSINVLCLMNIENVLYSFLYNKQHFPLFLCKELVDNLVPLFPSGYNINRYLNASKWFI